MNDMLPTEEDLSFDEVLGNTLGSKSQEKCWGCEETRWIALTYLLSVTVSRMRA